MNITLICRLLSKSIHIVKQGLDDCVTKGYWERVLEGNVAETKLSLFSNQNYMNDCLIECYVHGIEGHYFERKDWTKSEINKQKWP